MNLPKSLDPSPLISSTIEIRFDSLIKGDELLNVFYPLFINDLPKLSHVDSPEMNDTHEHLKIEGVYALSNEDYTLSFSNSSISFENTNEYTGWEKYFPFISKQYKTFEDTKLINSINRIGLRYGSVLPQKSGLRDIFHTLPSFQINGFKEELSSVKTTLFQNDYIFQVHIARDVQATKREETKVGTLVDIDSSLNTIQRPGNHILTIINELHDLEKALFFGLLKPDYLESLNPKY